MAAVTQFFTIENLLVLLAALRIVLGSLTVYYYSLFSRRLDALFYQWRIRQLTAACFVLEAAADLALSFLANTPILFALRETGQLGVAYFLWLGSYRALKFQSSAVVLVAPLLLTGIVNVWGLDIDVLSLASMALVFLAIRNYSVYARVQAVRAPQASARKLFQLSLLSAYMFQFIGSLLGKDLFMFVEMSELIAVALGFYVIRAAVRSARQG